MPFIGSINDKLRKFFWTHAPALEGRKCYIGCSGNFTVEQILSRRCKSAEIYSNDVSLYSGALGYMFTGSPFELEITNPELEWANEYIARGPAEMVSTLLVLLEMLKFEKRSSLYAERMWSTYLLNFESMMKKTLEKVIKVSEHIRIQEYTMTDVFDYYPRPGDVSIGFLPTYVGGYEKLFARLEGSAEWEKPAYEMLTTERREETINKMTEGEYILYDDQERELPRIARVDLFGRKTVYIYSNINFKRGIFRKKINEKPSRYDMLMPEEEIPEDSEIKMEEVDLSTMNHYRNMFLSKKIQPGSGGPCFLVFAGNKLFGFLIFQVYSKKGGPSSEIYMMSDFVIPSTRHRRLAKLLLMAIKCRDLKERLDEKYIKDYTTILTTAFTRKAVSMKYRGAFKLAKRGEDFLNYRGEFGQTTFKEVVKLWKKKYEKR